jgi:G3E family GTPase
MRAEQPGLPGAPLPMTVIGGFLGAGKTSYLNALIQAGIAPGSLILVNDFGDINIDSALIDYRDDRVIGLTNGCICCTLGGTLAEQLAEVLRFTPRPTAIYIEASGVADTARIADIARVSRQLRLEEVVCLVDASQALANADHPLIGEAWRDQVRAAHRLLLNRLPDDSDFRQQLHALLDALNPEAERLLLASPEGVPTPRPAPPAPRFAAATRAGGAHPCTSVTLRPSGAIDIDAVDALLADYSDVLLRAKGFLRCRGQASLRLLQFSGRTPQWQASLRPPAEPQLVLIGTPGGRFEALCSALMALAND